MNVVVRVVPPDADSVRARLRELGSGWAAVSLDIYAKQHYFAEAGATVDLLAVGILTPRFIKLDDPRSVEAQGREAVLAEPDLVCDGLAAHGLELEPDDVSELLFEIDLTEPLEESLGGQVDVTDFVLARELGAGRRGGGEHRAGS